MTNNGTNEKQVREWTVYCSVGNGQWYVDHQNGYPPIYDDENHLRIKVVDFVAYQSVSAKLEAMKKQADELEKERDSAVHEFKMMQGGSVRQQKEIQELKSENEELKAERDSWRESYEALEWSNK